MTTATSTNRFSPNHGNTYTAFLVREDGVVEATTVECYVNTLVPVNPGVTEMVLPSEPGETTSEVIAASGWDVTDYEDVRGQFANGDEYHYLIQN